VAVDQTHRVESPSHRPPKRSRWVRLLRIAGWVSIAAGVLILGFVAQQLFVTTWLAERNQSALTEAAEQRFASVEVVEVAFTTEPEDGSEAASADPAASVSAATEDQQDLSVLPSEEPSTPEVSSSFTAGGDEGAAGNGSAEPSGAAPSGAPPSGSAADDERTLFVEPEASEDEPIAIITIPSIERLEEGWTVVEGVGTRDLKNGAGHMPRTPMPGQPGNAVISGHRTTYGAPFHELDELVPGDQIEVESAIGLNVYEVHESIVVAPIETWVTAPREGSWLTLTTCNPKFSSRQRLVVFAELVSGPNYEAIYS